MEKPSAGQIMDRPDHRRRRAVVRGRGSVRCVNVNRIVIFLGHSFRGTITKSEVQQLERQTSSGRFGETVSPCPKGELGPGVFQIKVTLLASTVIVAEHRGRVYESESSLVR